MNILAMVIALAVIAQVGFVNWVLAVELIPLNGTNSTLNQALPIFYDCIDKAVEQSVNVQEDAYFKDEPTKNEVVTCYNKVLIDANGLDKLIYRIRFQKSNVRLNNSKKNFHDYCSVNIIKVQHDCYSSYLNFSF